MLKYFVLSQILLSLVFIFVILFGVSFLTLWERKLLGGIQRRHGPIFTGIIGILQPFADGLKLLCKTFNFPAGGYYHAFLGSSIFSLTLSLSPWAIMPFNSFFVFADVNCNLLLVLLFSSLNKYTILFSGWSSNSKYGVLGSIRSGAQVASYEVPLLMSLLPIILLSSSLNLFDVVDSQFDFFWFIVFVPNAFIFFVCILAETNRTPFDLPEAESELVAGYNIEYSSMSFAVFFLAEYNHIIIVSFLFSLLFLGGWNLFSYSMTLLLILKSFIITNLIIYMRGILPRYKFTDLITMCWQVFVPITALLFLLVYYGVLLAEIEMIVEAFVKYFIEIGLFFTILSLYILFNFTVYVVDVINYLMSGDEAYFRSYSDVEKVAIAFYIVVLTVVTCCI